MSQPRFCKDCIYCKPHWFWPERWTLAVCLRTAPNPVSGKKDRLCSTMRQSYGIPMMDEGQCGRDAQFFEGRPK